MASKLLIELKVKYPNLDNAREILKKVGAKFLGKYHQTDIYYLVGEKRLKLRSVNGREYYLVYYERPNVADIKQSKVILTQVLNGEEMNNILESILGIKVIVDKIREIYEYRGVRIHLDSVKHLGSFIEFEKVTTKDQLVSDRRILKDLMSMFKIKVNDLADRSYSDMLMDILRKSSH